MSILVDLLVKNGVVVTCDPRDRIVKSGAVAVQGSRVVAVGTVEELERAYKADREIDATGMVITPGLVNSHTHLPMTLFRGVADDIPAIEWLPRIWSIEKNLTEETCYAGALLGCLEMIKSGTTCFADQYFHMDQVAKAVEKSGMRAVLAQGVLELGDLEKGKEQLKESADFAREWNGEAEGRIGCKIGPHAIYSCSTGLLKEARQVANEIAVGLHIHLAEAPNEIKMVKEKHGKTPTEHLANIGFLSPDVIAAHCIFLDNSDIEILQRTMTGVAHCPSTVMKYGGGISPVPDLVKRGISVGIGTDGCGSNNNLDMIEEMRTAAFLHKLDRKDATVLPAKTMLKLATIGSARAIGLQNEVGSIEVGKRADMILVDFRKPHLTPFHNVVGHLVYSSFGSDVHTTIIDGKVVMENRQVLTLDEDEVMREAQREFERLLDKGGWSPTMENPSASFRSAVSVKIIESYMKIMQMMRG